MSGSSFGIIDEFQVHYRGQVQTFRLIKVNQQYMIERDRFTLLIYSQEDKAYKGFEALRKKVYTISL